MTRGEHIAWAKKRAIEYLDDGGNVKAAITSMMSDLDKHPDTKAARDDNMRMAFAMLVRDDAASARRFIESFN